MFNIKIEFFFIKYREPVPLKFSPTNQKNICPRISDYRGIKTEPVFDDTQGNRNINRFPGGGGGKFCVAFVVEG